jgi:hypothetical protein
MLLCEAASAGMPQPAALCGQTAVRGLADCHSGRRFSIYPGSSRAPAPFAVRSVIPAKERVKKSAKGLWRVEFRARPSSPRMLVPQGEMDSRLRGNDGCGSAADTAFDCFTRSKAGIHGSLKYQWWQMVTMGPRLREDDGCNVIFARMHIRGDGGLALNSTAQPLCRCFYTLEGRNPFLGARQRAERPREAGYAAARSLSTAAMASSTASNTSSVEACRAL